MRLPIFIACLLLIQKVYNQEVSNVETQRTTELSIEGQSVDWDTTNPQGTRKDNLHVRLTGEPQLPSTPNYGPMYLPFSDQPYGTRIQQSNDTMASSRSYVSDGPPEIYRSRDVVGRSSDTIRQTLPNGMLPYHPLMYYPPPPYFSNGGRIPSGYPLPTDVVSDFPDSNFSNNENPDYAAARIFGRDRYPTNLGGLVNPELFLRGDVSVRNVRNMFPFVPYSLPLNYFSPTIPSSDEDRVDIFVRPPYYDREPGSDSLENIPAKKDAAEEQPPQKQPEEAETTYSDVAVPAEPVPAQFFPRIPLPINSFPYGIPPPELVPPFPYPVGQIPPTLPPSNLPPIFPNIPPPSEDNLLNSVLNKPTGPVEPIISSDELPPVENIPSEIKPDQSVEAKNPYEFGFAMNDGRGTDQHRKEVSDGSGAVSGSYGYKDAFGVYRLVNYIADKNGFRAFIHSNEPGIANPGSADVTVVAEMPPLQAVAEALRTLKVDTIEVPNEPVEPIPQVIEK